MQTEKQLQEYLRKEVHAMGGTFDKLESRSRRGFPDCLIVYRGLVVFVELKSPTGKGQLSPLQVKVIDDLREHGANVFVVDDKESADRLLGKVLKCLI